MTEYRRWLHIQI